MLQLGRFALAFRGRGRPFGFYTNGGRELVVELPFDSRDGKKDMYGRDRDNMRWHFGFPWALKFHRHEALIAGDEWNRAKPGSPDFHPDGTWVRLPRHLPVRLVATEWKLPFAWKDPKTGRVDQAQCTFHGDRMTWRRKWLPWTDLFSKTSTCVALSFSDEIGPGKGSYKGGIIGTGFEMKPGETAAEAVNRAQTELEIRR